ncbi:fas-binding factor 1 homolog, partial [Brachionichthys hirsutus]|uniref:fas-binding factor 1 homolog n=1 Tax=Brachionichthys hirsutus TaxID=412623 RepID=UPI003604320A
SSSSATDDFLSMLAEDEKRDEDDTEDSEVSAADPADIMKNLMEMDGLEEELFPSKKKPSSAPAQTKSFKKGQTKDSFESHVRPDGAATTEGRKPNSAPSFTARKKFTVSDDLLDDELDDLLADEDQRYSRSGTQPDKPGKSVPTVTTQTPKATKNEGDVTFDDVVDDFMDPLGLDDDKRNSKKKDSALWPNEESREPPQRTQTKLHMILESFTSPSLLERSLMGERKNPPLSQEKHQQDVEEDDFTFGTYQPTLASKPEGRPSRRQLVRFSAEDDRSSIPETKSKPTTPASSRQRRSADWLGLKTNDDDLFLETDGTGSKTKAESPKHPSSASLERKPSLTGGHAVFTAASETPPSADEPAAQAKLEVSKRGQEEDGWLTAALQRKKALAVPNSEAETSIKEDHSGRGKEVDLDLIVSKPVTSQAPRFREATAATETSNGFSGNHSPTAHSSPVREKRSKQVPQQNEIQNSPSAVPQVTLPADSLPQLFLQQEVMQSQLPGVGKVGDAGVTQTCREKDQPPGDDQTLQARIIQLEGQLKTLHLERDQNQLLESVHQHHKKDKELMENAHKARVKLLEESAAQREAQAQRECDDLTERLAAVTQSAERERSELQAQGQRKLAQAQKDRDQEVERLRELQRKSILEMKKDHEDQIQRLKKVKDEEIDAVTSATSQTRSLTVVIEQMEQFSARLGELSSRVESTHEHTAHGLEQEARRRDEQLQLMQDRLAQQQKAMAEERAHRKEIISRMDAQLNEQQRQLEKERWKVTAEQAKVESAQRGLEEERHALTMQTSMEREELDRAKSALLEEQKSVMQHCAEERRKLAAEREHFHAMEKQRYERAERDVNSLLEKREGSIISLAQEQADLKLRAAELKQKEIFVARQTESLERLRQELDSEKERISSSALRFRTKAQEVEAFSKLAAEKHEEGERALQKAKHVEAMHEARLAKIHAQAERLRQQEQRILKDQIQLRDLQASETPVNFLQTSSAILPDAGPVLPNPDLRSTTSSFNIESPALLALLKYNTDKDSAYLEDEQIFLDNLKKSF